MKSHTNVDWQVRGLPIKNRRRRVTRQGKGSIRNSSSLSKDELRRIEIEVFIVGDYDWVEAIAGITHFGRVRGLGFEGYEAWNFFTTLGEFPNRLAGSQVS